MPGKGVYLLSDYGGEPVGVLCEECELLKFISSGELMIEYGDHSMPSLISKIAEDIIKCPKPKEGFSGRCMLRYHTRTGSLIDTLKQAKPPAVKVKEIRNWEIVVAKCNYCGHVSNIQHWQLNRVAKAETTVDDIAKRLKCKRCSVKGDVKITVAKMPR
ncbi:hypothetical protein SAMN03159422_00244 [Agrobacterium fabrum]|uniref:hypothetical protein n=1 Tax=Agrobacterium fabrum TaxID=1176649 RepID=UPI000883915C|nr:hypothetical protein [Agrobacterium fabrum]MDH6294700.1 hypothetical protein [Agrobacterium fabrum]NTB07611.1 hypothetical protein [Agrobacterium fabrum]SDB14737.1 hypothetical protein SAMN03159422_00244 [Agrobacterium fabrum]SEQ23639.1 hypothetical protein SAMN03159504_00244 [Agrobacterium fabrum]